jgi:glucokinase
MAERLAVAVDLGATRVRACVGTKSGRIIRRAWRKMAACKSVDDYLAQITGVTRGVTKGFTPGELGRICLASPGPLDLKRGLITHAANLPYANVPVIETMEKAFEMEAYLVNDANAAALGEWLRGAGKGLRDVFYLTISTGIGGGAIVDGKLLLGKDGNAAEVGHLTIDIEGRLKCGCGKKGHWEAYCSGSGIPAFTRLLGDEPCGSTRMSAQRSPLLKGGERVDAARVFREASRGDPFALRVVREVGRLNAIGVADVTDAYDPEIVTLGGGVALNNQEAIVSPIRKYVGDHPINRVPKVRVTPLGDDAGLLGALAASFEPALIGR